MKVETQEILDRRRKPKTITLEVADPITRRTVHKVEISRSEAQEAIDYLRQHNGHAPQFVHGFIDAMEVAMALRL